MPVRSQTFPMAICVQNTVGSGFVAKIFAETGAAWSDERKGSNWRGKKFSLRSLEDPKAVAVKT